MKVKTNWHTTISLSEVHKERVGQLVNYLAFRLSPYLYSTKLFKLLYILDERSIVETGIPISWLKYNVYEMGPVPENIWINIKTGNELLGDYFDVLEKDGKYQILPVSRADLSEFSKREAELIEEVINEYGASATENIIDYLHEEKSLWYKIVKENNISFKHSPATDYVIDLTDRIKGDSNKMMLFNAAKEEIKILESFT